MMYGMHVSSSPPSTRRHKSKLKRQASRTSSLKIAAGGGQGVTSGQSRNPLHMTRSLQSQQSCSSLPLGTLTSLPSTSSSIMDVQEGKQVKTMYKRLSKTSSLDEYQRPISTITSLRKQMSGHSMASGQSGGDTIEMTDILPVPEGDEEFMTVPAQRIPKTQRLINFIKEAWNGMTSSGSVGSSEEDGDLDGEDAHVRIKPEKIETLCKITKFTRRELQLMYRGFKQDCPTGLVKEETFKSIYAQFFPRTADTSQYAHFVFNTFDPNRSGAITFTDFVIGLSALSRGTVQDKLRWIFSLYDLDGDGVLTKDELYRMISSIYDLLGRSGDIHSEEIATKQHAELVFEKLDLNKNGIVTMEDFLDSCLRDERITKSLAVFNTIL